MELPQGSVGGKQLVTQKGNRNPKAEISMMLTVSFKNAGCLLENIIIIRGSPAQALDSTVFLYVVTFDVVISTSIGYKEKMNELISLANERCIFTCPQARRERFLPPSR